MVNIEDHVIITTETEAIIEDHIAVVQDPVPITMLMADADINPVLIAETMVADKGETKNSVREGTIALSSKVSRPT